MWGVSAAVFPASSVVLLVSTIVCVYIVAVSLKHVNPVWPYISDCACLYPESSIFGQMIDISAAIVSWTLFLRFKRILDVVGEAGEVLTVPVSAVARKVIVTLSCIAFLFSIVAMFGVIMVGNFQENKPGGVHSVAALLTFLGCCVYMTGDASVSWVLRRPLHQATADDRAYNRRVPVGRIVVTSLAWVTAIVSITGRQLSHKYWNDAFPNQTASWRNAVQLRWNSTDPGYSVHVMSTSCEWITGLMFIIYLCTFIVEFRRFSAKVKLQPLAMSALRQPESQDPVHRSTDEAQEVEEVDT